MTRLHLPRRLTQQALPALLLLGVVATGLAPSADGDVWWHLAAGREMVARGALLFSDPFSVSAAGRPWIDVHWLFQLALYAVHSGFGLAGLVWLKCLCLGAGALLLFAAVGRDKLQPLAPPVFVSLLLAALFVSRQLLLVRPVMVTLLCLAVFFYELERFRVAPQPRRLAVLGLVQVLWANCQGLSALGPAVVAAYAVAAGVEAWLGARPAWPFAREAEPGASSLRRFKVLLVALVVCVAGSALTPFGVRGLWLPKTLLGRLVPGEHNVYAHTVAENVPPFLLERWTGGEFWHLKWFFLILGVTLVAGGIKLRLSHALLLGGFTALALLGNRNVLLLYWVVTPIAALHLAPALQRLARIGAGSRRFVLLANALVMLAVLGVASVAAARESSLSAPSAFRVPAESARRLASLPGGADVFSADHHGGYLIWQLYPRFRPYIDTRLVLRTPHEFAEYLSLADEPERFDAFQAQHHFGYVVLPVAYPDRYLGLVAHLYRSPDWRLLYTDGSEVLFGRRDLAQGSGWDLADAATTARILNELHSKLSEQPKLALAARLHLATLQIAVGETAQAERVLSGMPEPEARTLLARCRFLAGDFESARALAWQQWSRDRDDTRSLSLLARVALERGELARGASLVRRTLRADPFDAEANRLLTSLEESQP